MKPLCAFKWFESVVTQPMPLLYNPFYLLCPHHQSLLCSSKNNGLYLLEEEVQLAYSEASVGLEALWDVCRAHSTRPPLGSFHSHNFRQVMGFLLHNNNNK